MKLQACTQQRSWLTCQTLRRTTGNSFNRTMIPNKVSKEPSRLVVAHQDKGKWVITRSIRPPLCLGEPHVLCERHGGCLKERH
jgi:hypothetical protein